MSNDDKTTPRIIQTIPDTAGSPVNAPNGQTYRAVGWAVVERTYTEMVPDTRPDPLTGKRRPEGKTRPRHVTDQAVEALVDPDDTGVLVLVSSLKPKPAATVDMDAVLAATADYMVKGTHPETDDVIVYGHHLSEEDRVGTARHVPHRAKFRIPRGRAEVLGVPYREIRK